MLTVKRFIFNAFQVNCYLLYDETQECVIIDAASYSEKEHFKISNFIENQQLKPVSLLTTHGHLDHIFGNGFLFSKYNLKPLIHEADAFFLDILVEYAHNFGLRAEASPEAERLLEDNDELKFGNSVLKVIHVPGHSPGGVAFYNEAQQLLFSGDILFRDSVGRTDLPGGNHAQLMTGIKHKLLVLPDETTVYPGHNDETTIGYEKAENMYLK